MTSRHRREDLSVKRTLLSGVGVLLACIAGTTLVESLIYAHGIPLPRFLPSAISALMTTGYVVGGVLIAAAYLLHQTRRSGSARSGTGVPPAGSSAGDGPAR